MKGSRKKKNKPLTIDDLAAMTQRGFDSVHTEFKSVRGEIKGVRDELVQVNRRLDVIEHKHVGSHDRRLDRIEDDMRIVKTALEQKLSVTFPK